MRKVMTVESLEAIVGTPPLAILMKSINTLDDGCRRVLASAPVAGFGFRDREGVPRATIVGGAPGFLRVDSPTRVSFDLRADLADPARGSGVSSVFLLPGIGETLRLNGFVAERSGAGVVIDLEEALVHCGKCTLRSGLWEDIRTDPRAPRVEPPTSPDVGASGPLADASVATFLASSPFVFLSSWDAGGSSDTSPKGDRPGFMRILDGHTLAIPDRKGNQRTDTFHNVLTCDQIALAAIVPGRDDVLHISGTASVTDDPALLSTMVVKGGDGRGGEGKGGEKPPKTAMIVRVERAAVAANDAVPTMWDRAARVDRSQVPDLMHLAAKHLASNKARGVVASLTRALSRGLAASPKLARRAIDFGYRKELEDEGY